MPTPSTTITAVKLSCLRCGYAPERAYLQPWDRCPKCRSHNWWAPEGMFKRGGPGPKRGVITRTNTLRAAIRAVLAEHPNSTAPEVTQYLELKNALPPDSRQTSLKIRVMRHLRRMHEIGYLEKDGPRYSLLTEKGGR